MKDRKQSVSTKKKWNAALIMIGFCLCAFLTAGKTSKKTFVQEFLTVAENKIYLEMVRQYMPAVSYHAQGWEEKSLSEIAWEKMARQMPLIGFAINVQEYDSAVESTLSYEDIIALEGRDEADAAPTSEEVSAAAQKENENSLALAAVNENEEAASQTPPVPTPAADELVRDTPLVEIPLEKLNDFDYLMQNFYQVDNTTTIDGSILNAQELLNCDLKVTTPADQPQILIYHTHSQEMFADSDPADVMTGVMGVGEYLTQLLQEQYGFNVIHHMGQYDVGDRDHAYAAAEGPVEQVLAENPSIEVVIDLHRDAFDKHLVRDVNGVPMAPIMFFNGLSRTKALGDISYLKNENLSGNLAFSLQMQVAAAEYYPNLTRPIYLKGYRYNMHFKEKTLLIEMGSYMNTQEEAHNAMVPLADLLDKVLHGN